MSRVPIPLPLNLAEAQSRAVSNELCVNCFAEAGKDGAILRHHPGLRAWVTGASNYRGCTTIGGTLYAVLGERLYQIGGDGSQTDKGSVPGANPAILTGDSSQLVVNASGDSYVLASSLNKVTDPDYRPASSVAYINGTALWSAAEDDLFFWSAISAASDIDGLDIATAEFRSDKLVRIVAYRNEPLMMGAETIEGWFDSGDSQAPYQRRQDVLLDIGLAGGQAVAEDNDTLFWLANDGTVRMLAQGAPARISTEAVERRINGDAGRGIVGWGDLSLTRAFTYVYRGHLFVTFRHPNGCVQFDLTTKLWTERRSYGSPTWTVVDAVFAYGRYMLVTEAGVFCDFNETSRYDLGSTVEWIAVLPTIEDRNRRIILDMVEFVFDMGRGGLSTAPLVSVYYSDDGYDFDLVTELQLGLSGQYDLLARLRREGQTRQRTYKLVITDDVPATLIEINADTRVCRD